MPSTETEWEAIASKTADRWQYPNCIGACDGKHIGLVHPKDSASDFFSYKSFFSIVLLPLVDYDYKFIYVGVGCQGCIRDSGVYRNSSLCKALSNGTLNYQDLDHCQRCMPFVFVVGDAFPLTVNIMKPYTLRNLDDRKGIFNAFEKMRLRF